MGDNTTFIQKLKEKQEAQKQLVQAIDDLQREKHRIMMERLKYLLLFIMAIGAAGFIAASLGPYAKSIIAEVGTGIGNLFSFSDIKHSAGKMAGKMKDNLAQPDAAPAAPKKKAEKPEGAQAEGTPPPAPAQNPPATKQTEQESPAPAPVAKNPPPASEPAPPAPAAQVTPPPASAPVAQATPPPAASEALPVVQQPEPAKPVAVAQPPAAAEPAAVETLHVVPIRAAELPASPPSPRQNEVANMEWVAPAGLPAPTKTLFREAPAPVAQRFSVISAALSPAPAPPPAPSSYRSLKELPLALQELDKQKRQGY